MRHWKTLVASDYLGAWDLADSAGNPIEVSTTIEAIEWTELFDAKSKRRDKLSRKAVMSFRNLPKPLVLSKTHLACFAAQHGDNADAWVGKPVTLYPARTKFGRDKVECIRVRTPVDLIRSHPAFTERLREKLLAEYAWEITAQVTPREARPDQNDDALIAAIDAATTEAALSELAAACKQARDVAAVRARWTARRDELRAVPPTREPGED